MMAWYYSLYWSFPNACLHTPFQGFFDLKKDQVFQFFLLFLAQLRTQKTQSVNIVQANVFHIFHGSFGYTNGIQHTWCFTLNSRTICMGSSLIRMCIRSWVSGVKWTSTYSNVALLSTPSFTLPFSVIVSCTMLKPLRNRAGRFSCWLPLRFKSCAQCDLPRLDPRTKSLLHERWKCRPRSQLINQLINPF